MDTPEDEPQPELEPGQDLPPGPGAEEPKRRGRPKGSRNRASAAGGSGDVAPLPQRASKIARETAGDLYALLGTGAMIGGFHAAGACMQAQAPQAGGIIANHALAQWPRFYRFLERAGKASGVVPLFLCPVMAEVFVRSQNQAAVVLSHGILAQLAGDLQVTLPDPETGQPVQVAMMDALSMARMDVMAQQASANGHPAPEPEPADTEAQDAVSE